MANSDPQKAQLDELAAEHRALKERTDALRREHDQLHKQGGTKAEHQEHIRHLRQAINDLERHVAHLKNVRTPGGREAKKRV